VVVFHNPRALTKKAAFFGVIDIRFNGNKTLLSDLVKYAVARKK